MISYEIFLKSIVDIKNFVNVVNTYDFDIDLESGRYTIDAKSIMGIFSLDLSKPINMHVHSDDAEKIEADLQSYITKALESEENE
ncbi:MAG: HPr family phosphocarrier protein [Clostridia bacterium]|jgi:phosphotransferase system HPr-like phosphotransfer protein|nr:HPr family phosphocarrier protein [Clostridia bacterium]